MSAHMPDAIERHPDHATPRPPLVYMIILNYNGPEMTVQCAESVLKVDCPNFGVLLVDNAPTDDSAQRLRQCLSDPRLELPVNDKNCGYTGGDNGGINRAQVHVFPGDGHPSSVANLYCNKRQPEA